MSFRRRPRLYLEHLESRDALAAGALDPAFGVGGVALANFAASFGDQGQALALQVDGKVVVAGSVRTSAGSDFGVVRFNADGTLDTSFGTNGTVLTPVGTGNDFAQGVAIQADGKIVVVGYAFTGSATGWDFAVVRYLTDGSLDTSFGTGGKVTTAFSGASFDAAYGVAIQADGRIVVAGQSNPNGTSNDFALVRYLGDGSLDGSFGTGGRATVNFQGTSLDNAYAVALQADGKMVVTGSSSTDSSDFALARLTSAGLLDSTFGTLGLVRVDVATGSHDVASALAVQSDGKIVLAGYTYNGNYDFALVRVNSDGILDSSFDGDGKVVTNFVAGSMDTASGVVVQGDGRIVAVGLSNANGTSNDFALVRYLADGSLDTSFGTGGRVTTNVSGFSSDVAKGAVLQSDGKIVIAGYSNGGGTGDDFAVARYAGSDNAPPVANAGGPYSLAEGSSLVLNGSGSDPNQDGATLFYEWDLDADGVFGETGAGALRGDEAGATPTFSAAGLDGPSNFNVTLRVTDNGGLSSTASVAVSITNAAPSANAGADQTAHEGQTVHLTGTATDPGPDSFSYDWQVVNTAGEVVATGDQADFAFVPDDDGVYTVTFTVTDDDGANSSDSMVVTVDNVAPSASISGPATGVRGQARDFLLSATDPAGADTAAGFTFSINWGDGSAATQTTSTTASHTYNQAGVYTVSVTAWDKDGGSSTVSMTVTIFVAELQTNADGTTDLVVGGTSGNDRISFRAGAKGSVVVNVNDKVVGSFRPTGGLVAYGLAGNDHIHVANDLALAAWLDGGAGNDFLHGGRGNDTLIGGVGDDRLNGHRGNNVFPSGPGKDRIIGPPPKKHHPHGRHN